jgi:hypothetical protein
VCCRSMRLMQACILKATRSSHYFKVHGACYGNKVDFICARMLW